MAQLVEQRIRNAWVPGSSPGIGSMKRWFVILFLPINILAQRPAVTPLDYSDRDIDQLAHKVKSISETIYKVNYSTGEVQIGDFIAATAKDYNVNGDLTLHQTFEESGFLLTKTVYQYPKVTTTYDANGNRTSQTLYSFTADNLCARMRFTDAMGITISTSEISHYTNHSRDEETFADGEYIRCDYYFNKNKRLTKVVIVNDKREKKEYKYSLEKSGYPKRETITADGNKTVISYTYTLDDYGNWTTRIAYVDGTPTEITIRKITYY